MDTNSGFVSEAPSTQNVIDLFDGEWSTAMPSDLGAVSRPGHAGLFTDGRISWAGQILGPFRGLDILELGPLEGAHSFMLEQLGAASITAIEANARAFLKCLCIKEVMGMLRVRFMLGSFLPYLEQCRFIRRYHCIWCAISHDGPTFVARKHRREDGSADGLDPLL